MSISRDLAKKLSPKASTTQAQPAPKVEFGRATVTAIPGDGTLTVNLNGSTVAMPVDDCTGGTAVVDGQVEVLIAPPRHIALPVIGQTSAEMYDIGGDGPTVGTLPTSGLRNISISWVGPCATFGGSEVTIDLTFLGLSTGYNVVTSSGDESTGVLQSAPIAVDSTLTSLVVEIATAAGGALTNGTVVRVNLALTGA